MPSDLKLGDPPKAPPAEQLGHASLGANDAAHKALQGAEGSSAGVPVVLVVIVALAVLGVTVAMVRGRKPKA